MVTVELMGGLGNQLFQYFFGYAMAKRHGINVKYTSRDCKLHKVNIQVTPYKVHPLKTRTFNQGGFGFSPITPQENTNYVGYWQSEKFFSEYRKDIQRLFNIPVSLPDVVSLHVRRGDYLHLKDYHPVLPRSYYIEAVKKFKGQPIWVFSDDLAWCEKNLPSDWRFVGGRSDVEDFFTMASCQHHIIANSTFSWWAAWLNGKEVVAPKTWFGKQYGYLDTRDLIPENWKKI